MYLEEYPRRPAIIDGKRLAVCLLTISVLMFSCGSALRGKSPEDGKAVDKWETSTRSFKFRVTVYREKEPIWLPHYDYVVESAKLDSEVWREILRVRFDDNRPIPQDHLRYLNDEVAYFYISDKYAVTVDGSNSWSVWDGAGNIPKGDVSYPVFIKEVSISADGDGVMKLASSSTKTDLLELHTNDLGQHWNK